MTQFRCVPFSPQAAPCLSSRLAGASRLRPLALAMMLAGVAPAVFAADTNVDPAAPANSPASADAANKPAAMQLQEVEVNASSARSAITMAPVQSELEVTQPTSVIGLDWIANHEPPTADYAAIAAMAPSVSSISPAGPGLGEAKQVTMRGFNDNQYNVTYDGIPFGDTNDFSHHTSSYFPAKMIGQVSVDRGPGGASTIGEATFGGTIALRSKDPLDQFEIIPTQTFGSYSTTLSHLELNTGRMEQVGGGRLIASAQYYDSDTFRTDSGVHRKTAYIKYVQPIGTDTEITVLSNYNDIKFNNPDKTTLTQAQINTLGRNFGLNHDPTTTDCTCYNFQTKQTDLEYIGIKSALTPDWTVDNKTYTYYYNNDSHESPTIGTNASKTNMGGAYKVNKYRAWGDVLTLSYATAYGTLRVGGWYEMQKNDRNQVLLDYTLGGIHDVKPGKPDSSAYKYTMRDWLRTAQLYAEYEWKATDALTVTPGVKSLQFTRDIEAPINQTTKTPLYYDQTWRKTLGYLAANYLLTPEWSVYGQAAQGFLAPNLNQFYVPDPSKNRAAPQQTMNYQFGTVYKTDRFSMDADVFYIDYKNFPLSSVDPVTKDPIFALARGARLYGVEGTATYYFGNGVSAFANFSTIDAAFRLSSLDIPNVPDGTMALGLSYEGDGLFGSLTSKYIGGQKVYNSGFSPDDATTVTSVGKSDGFWQTALSLGYGRNIDGSFIKSYKFRLQVENLFNAHNQVADSIKNGNIYYLVLPGRNWYASVSLGLW
ncbi:MAG: TonB-dependent receptor [Rudaea sp.]|uniref:TonB-dependent receptor n=1 Tax=unclassified Rudaea TaxID=2627037 RepID=UPI0010F48030|nr:MULTISPECIES: TonB-dependent receptor [unclassified Rudaea]MBN8884544.1 TonB-dependent receptor [Rudaea sp.]MBR0346109.1 TonB-dependent receptor [Rudaea sp.]